MLPIVYLLALRVPPSAARAFTSSGAQPHLSVLRVEDHWYYLHPEYMETPGPYTAQSNALLCLSCVRHLREGRQPHAQHRGAPALSIAAGFEFSKLARCALPELSLVEKLFLRMVNVYGHILKFSKGNDTVALSGHLIAVPTSAAERVVELGRALQVLPRQDVDNFITISFIGPMDQFNRVLGRNPEDELYVGRTYALHLRGLPHPSSPSFSSHVFS